ncbi:MAG: beta-sandwich domain-containing protein [Bdellovibrionia bacterium]
MKAIFKISLASLMTLGALASTAHAGNNTEGAIVGAIIGAAAGNQVGNGSGRDAATVVGAFVGAVVGSNSDYGRNDYVRPNPPRYPDHPRNPPPPSRPGYPREPVPPHNPYPPYPTPPPHNGYYESSAIIPSVSRAIGGEWVRIQFDRPVSVDTLIVQTYRAGLRVYEGFYYTDRNQRYDIRSFWRSGVIYNGQSLYSERLPAYDRITSVDLRIESMGGFADAYLRILSYDGPVYPRVIRY